MYDGSLFRGKSLGQITHLVPAFLGLISFFLIIGVCAYLLRRMLIVKHLRKQDYIFLSLIPPAFNDASLEATDKLFAVLHGLLSSRSMLDWLMGYQPVLTLEVISSRSGGICYQIRVAAEQAAHVEQSLIAYFPSIQFSREEEVAPSRKDQRLFSSVMSAQQSGHFAAPLDVSPEFSVHDPIAYLTAALTKLDSNDRLMMQLLIRPARSRYIARYRRKILGSSFALASAGSLVTLSARLIGRLLYTAVAVGLFLVRLIVRIPTGIMFRSHHTAARNHRRHTDDRFTDPGSEYSHLQTITKLQQSLFETDLRFLVTCADQQTTTGRSQGLMAALSSYSVPGSQALILRTPLFERLLPIVKSRMLIRFDQRLPSFKRAKTLVLSSTEIAALYHFPRTDQRTENLVRRHSRLLPAPLSLKQTKDYAVQLGVNVYHGERTVIGLSEAERARHVFMLGGTGSGKTTTLLYAAVQDIKAGRGVAVIDPHGDLAGTLLGYIPESRIADVIYFNPDDMRYPVGMNLLEIRPGLSDTELIREKDLITESVVSVFRKLFSEDDSGGHRIEYVLRNAVQTVLTLDNPTLFSVFRLLTNMKYRAEVTAGLVDHDLKSFWREELGRAGDYQRVKMSAGITSKIGRFLFTASARRVLQQPHSTLDFNDLLESGKILICNFSKGLLGEDTSALFGILTLAQLQLATLRRARMREVKRQTFYVYVDEFQNFATMSFVQLLSEARKYKLSLTIAEQSTSQQQDRRMVDMILANVGTIVCFRTGGAADEAALYPLFRPYIDAGEIARLPAHHFYLLASAVHPSEPLSGETVLVAEPPLRIIAQRVIASSRRLYARRYKPVDTSSIDAQPQQVMVTSAIPYSPLVVPSNG